MTYIYKKEKIKPEAIFLKRASLHVNVIRVCVKGVQSNT